MASNLKWNFGFGWVSVIILLGFVGGAIIFNSALRFVFVILALMVIIYLIYQYRKWNSSAWRKVHFRGMLLYAGIAGREVATAKVEQRDSIIKESCRSLGIAMCGAGSDIFVNAMVDELSNEEGEYCARLLKEHHNKVLPNVQQISEILRIAKQIRFGPQLVICNIIENTYGGEEAAKYILALISREAH